MPRKRQAPAAVNADEAAMNTQLEGDVAAEEAAEALGLAPDPAGPEGAEGVPGAVPPKPLADSRWL